MFSRIPLRRLGATIAMILSAGIVTVSAGPAMATTYVPISGAGSSWSSNALDQWRRNVKQYGMTINYASTGSSDGRNQFRNGTVDFGVTEVPYGIDPGDPAPNRNFSYIPIVAGGTAFMYNLTVGGARVANLRLSGDVISKIFTGVITKWNDPLIAADNPGLTLPDRAVVPVVRSDGSGSTAQFTLWMNTQYKSIWSAYCAKVGLTGAGCGETSFYPKTTGMVSQPNSQGVSGYVAQTANEGTITYVEYSYALKTGFPVVKVLNKAGYYVEPTASNVAVGLLGAKIKSDLTQDLNGVYNNTDPRAYPLSSYSYMLIPTAVVAPFSTAKGTTLSAFANYFLCEGQQQAEALGYSPLPINLVTAGLAQVKLIPGAETDKVDITKCNNPTFSSTGENLLAKNAPQPSACDKKGVTQCTTGTGGAASTTTAASGGTVSTTGTGATDTAGGAVTAGSLGAAGGVLGTGPTKCDPDTGICSSVRAVPITTPAEGWTMMNWVIVTVIGLIILFVAVPPIAVTIAARRNR